VSPATQKNRAVQILNPAGGVGYTSYKRAVRDVLRGRARWRNGKLQYIDSDLRHQAAVISAERLRAIEYDLAASTGFAPLDAIRNLPMAGDLDRLFGRGKQRRAGAKQAA
jgi:hypothetical protein